jgi:hypothetical protein
MQNKMNVNESKQTKAYKQVFAIPLISSYL